ncbi:MULTISPECIES: type VII secretion integral membrane protein EccD [Streptomyces]|uniref:Type VII secretion integral membrane protein EccD n=1 Tax=Streptomyces venezuelae TaxID=54571 RepID=A0A5P2BH81_STRVZ|nr:type VII secretion integral membrane protein EccD [Streptomyces venezuelae]MYY86321.1 type VII secretion integral membrane protein EccD [Streptomyces sp. SID335]MYZ13401.1 type VII secretion integral membrane protein EccD [Streptomyces sp. SID337]NDZ90058.1 type VII secretion integral membrane protein EccD [Streptomyces sp. SID10115]NEA04461.1 type VII secretion integral membrane protein EccD [Streptomyces sp. SID10116]NEB46414.1 type VII secretion integral membrane protein EccD [Streptomyc
MSSPAATGFCRVTVVAPDSRIDVALPEDIAVADIYPEVLRLTRQTQPAGTPTGYNLVRQNGTVLDGARTLAAQRVLDGEVLSLRPFAMSLPPAVYDDVADAVATAVVKDRRLWRDALLRGAGLTGSFLVLLLMAFVLWYADPVRHDMHGLPGIVAGGMGLLLMAFAGVRVRVYEDRAVGAVMGLAALPLLLIAGSGLIAPDAGQGPGRLQFLLGCVTVLVASVLLVVVSPGSDAPFVAATFLSAAGALATFVAITAEATPTDAAAVTAPVTIALVAFLPGLSSRFARLPIGYASPRSSVQEDFDADLNPTVDPGPLDAGRIAAQARRGHELLLGLVAGSASVVVGSAVVLGFSKDVWGQLLALATGLAMLLRARLFRYTSQVVCALVAGITAIALLLVGLALNPPGDALGELTLHGDSGPLELRAVWLTAAIALGCALLTAIALIIPTKGLSPFWGRFLDLTESAILLSLVPLCLAVLDVYSAARSLTS